MSITVRNWTKEDLEKIESNSDPFLTTIFFNATTFSKDAIKIYPHHVRKEYLCYFYDEIEPVTIYATDPENLKKFIEAEYTQYPEEIKERISTYKQIFIV